MGWVRQSAGAHAPRKRQYAVRRDDGTLPELRLTRALLEDAIHCFRRYLFARRKEHRLAYSEAEHWIMYERPDLPFSFEHVCDVLGVNPEYLRTRLHCWRAQQLCKAADANDQPGSDVAHATAGTFLGTAHIDSGAANAPAADTGVACGQ